MTDKQLQLVTFEQAKALKELGFDWKVAAFWDIRLNRLFPCYPLNNHNDSERFFSAPTVALALKWMRDVKGFDYSIRKGQLPFEYSFSLLNGTHGKLHIKGYEAAESALLDEIITFNCEYYETTKRTDSLC